MYLSRDLESRKEVKKVTNKKLLEEYISRRGLKKGFLAEQLGLSRQGFRNCLNNRAEFRASHIRILCELLELDAELKEAIFFAEARE